MDSKLDNDILELIQFCGIDFDIQDNIANDIHINKLTAPK